MHSPRVKTTYTRSMHGGLRAFRLVFLVEVLAVGLNAREDGRDDAIATCPGKREHVRFRGVRVAFEGVAKQRARPEEAGWHGPLRNAETVNVPNRCARHGRRLAFERRRPKAALLDLTLTRFERSRMMARLCEGRHRRSS